MIKIITGASLFQAAKNTIKNLPPDNTYIVVPDRATLVMEELVFDLLDLKCSFNLNVVGLSTLALRGFQTTKKPLSEMQAVLYVKKAVDNLQGKLKYFQSGNVSFCKQIYKFISQFKSSSLKPQDVVCKSERLNLKNKFEDLKMVYEEFEKLTQESLDPSEVLEHFAEQIPLNEEMLNSHFVFIGFDSFTSKHYFVIEQIAKYCRSLTVALAKPLCVSNAYIYETDIEEKLKKIAKSCKIEIQIESPSCCLTPSAKAIAENLFAKQQKYIENAKISIKEADIPKSEAEFVAKTICYQVYKGKRYKDFAVACSDLKLYAKELEIEFEKNKIPYYIDLSVNASQTYCALFFQKMISFAFKKFRKSDLLFLINSPFFDFDRELISNVAQYYNSNNENFYSRDFGELKELVKAISSNFFDGASQCVSFLEKNILKLNKLNLDAKNLSFELQMPDILAELLDAIQSTCNFSTLKEFISAVNIGLETKEVSALPSYYDQVFIGDATASYFGDVDTLFVVGANAGLLPKYDSEASFLTDEEIENAKLKYKVEPTIKMINRRNRFKLFSLLTQFKSNLILSYSNADQEGKPLAKSIILNMLMKIFSINESDIIKNIIFPDDTDFQKLLFAVGRSVSDTQQLLFSKKAHYFAPELLSALKISEESMHLNRDISCAKELKLGTEVKPTEVEKFYDCPFKVYCENVLKLVSIMHPEFTPAEIGSIIHEIIANYGKIYKYKKLENSEIDKFLAGEMAKCFKDRILDDRDLLQKRLTKDVKKILQNIEIESENSSFKLWLVEEKLDGKVGNKNFTGRVDRVDRNGDVFRVIDYKTGKITSNLTNDLKYGKKLQLLAYAKLLQDKTGLKCGGVYYFDVKIGYKAKQKAQLVGISVQSPEDATNDKSKSSFVTDDDMQKFIKEAENLLLQGTDYIASGKFAPYPTKSSCEYCPYLPVCLYDFLRGSRRV